MKGDTQSPKTSDGDGISRRQVLAVGAAGLAAGAVGGLLEPLGASAQASPEDVQPAVNGTLKSVTAPNQFVLKDYHLSLDWPYPDAEPSGSEVSITVTGDSQLYRDGSGKTLGDFKAGDSLIAYVDWVEGELVASVVEPVYRNIRGTVNSRSGNKLLTSAGTVLLTDATLVWRLDGPAKFEALGDRSANDQSAVVTRGEGFGATCRLEPGSDNYVALQLVVE